MKQLGVVVGSGKSIFGWSTEVLAKRYPLEGTSETGNAGRAFPRQLEMFTLD